jgi:hypothetical protein
MTKLNFLSATALLVFTAGSAVCATTTSFIVTVQAAHGSSVPSLNQHDVLASVSNQPTEITSWHALRDDPAGLELWILIDDGIDSRVGIQINDIRNFIRQKAPAIKVAIGYLRNGSVQTVQKPTTDHEAATKAIRLPVGMPGISGSPYIALADFLHRLPVSSQPREVVLISSGIDPYYGPGPQNPYLETAIHDAQKAGVPIHSIYFSSAGAAGRSYRQINWGQNDLSELSQETGGEFYWQGETNPVAFQPFFEDLNRRLSGQYVMSVEVPKARSFESLHLHTESVPVKLVNPSQVYAR